MKQISKGLAIIFAAPRVQRASIWIGILLAIVLVLLSKPLSSLLGTPDGWLGWAGNFSGGFMGAMVAIWVFRRAADQQEQASADKDGRYRRTILAGIADFALEVLSITTKVEGAGRKGEGAFDRRALLYNPTVLRVALSDLGRLPLPATTALMQLDQVLRRLEGFKSLTSSDPGSSKLRAAPTTLGDIRLTYGNLAGHLFNTIVALDTDATYPRDKAEAKQYAGDLDDSHQHLLPDLVVLMNITAPRRGAITDLRPIEALLGRDET